jgi:hypothetical protein
MRLQESTDSNTTELQDPNTANTLKTPHTLRFAHCSNRVTPPPKEKTALIYIMHWTIQDIMSHRVTRKFPIVFGDGCDLCVTLLVNNLVWVK